MCHYMYGCVHTVNQINPTHGKIVLPGFLRVGWHHGTSSGQYLNWVNYELSI